MKTKRDIIELGTTPVGTAVYAWLDKPDPMGSDSNNYKPRFKVTVDFEPEDIEDWLNNFKAKTKEFVSEESKKTGKQYTPKQLWSEVDGKIRIVFHSNVKPDGGRYFKVYDEEVKETDRSVWGNSRLRVKSLGMPYAMAKDNAGISPIIGAIQVAEFSTGSGGGKSDFDPIKPDFNTEESW
jgi:nuclear transport factor 2 (NTF2) superfamily protein